MYVRYTPLIDEHECIAHVCRIEFGAVLTCVCQQRLDRFVPQTHIRRVHVDDILKHVHDVDVAQVAFVLHVHHVLSYVRHHR
jgi:hypothetical protein